MADSLTTNPIYVDLRTATKRTIFPGQGTIRAIVVTGIPAAIANNFALKSKSTAGVPVFHFTPENTTGVHSAHQLNYKFTDGLYFADSASDGNMTAGWTIGSLLIYL